MTPVLPVLATPFDMWRRLKRRPPPRQLDRIGHVSVIGTTSGGMVGRTARNHRSGCIFKMIGDWLILAAGGDGVSQSLLASTGITATDAMLLAPASQSIIKTHRGAPAGWGGLTRQLRGSRRRRG